jgi:hypothetical protein
LEGQGQGQPFLTPGLPPLNTIDDMDVDAMTTEKRMTLMKKGACFVLYAKKQDTWPEITKNT